MCIRDRNGTYFEFAHYGQVGAGSYFGGDDWLITPSILIPNELESLNLSFWAKSHSGFYLEDFELDRLDVANKEVKLKDFPLR